MTRTDRLHADGTARRGRGLTLRGRLLAVGLAALAAGLLSGGDGYGYRFYWHHDDERLRISENATRWDSAAWGPRDSLRWLIADEPGWTSRWDSLTREGETRAEDPPFRRARDAAPFIADALAAWVAVGSADIQWEVAGVEEGPGMARDGRSMVTALTEEAFEAEGALAYSFTWHERRRGPGLKWEFVECDVALSSSAAAILGSAEPANLATLIHELGHCIGLDHAAAHSVWEGSQGTVSVWGETPKMSYGLEVTNDPTLDDIVGASLLRPAGSWRRSVGSISGRVEVGGSAARYVAVLAARLAGDHLGRGVSTFADEQGRFRIEGLAPGDYLIWAGPMIIHSAHSELIVRGATLDARDGFGLEPVSVWAGAETGGVTLALQPGR